MPFTRCPGALAHAGSASRGLVTGMLVLGLAFIAFAMVFSLPGLRNMLFSIPGSVPEEVTEVQVESPLGPEILPAPQLTPDSELPKPVVERTLEVLPAPTVELALEVLPAPAPELALEVLPAPVVEMSLEVLPPPKPEEA